MNEFPATDFLILSVFWVSVAATVGGALLAVSATRIIRSVCGLAICCFGLASLYYLLHSPFLALMEILIYVGAICVTLVFAVMLAEPDEHTSRESRRAAVLWGGGALLVSGGAFWAIARLSLTHPWSAPISRVGEGTVQEIGIALLTTYSVAFELVSLVLVVAILGALVIARYGRTKP
jgi:NADH:ubiquinone oxidoreductase subunit 6 (subunit J)